MVVKKSYVKGKLKYWFILIFCLSLYVTSSYYYRTEPENFMSDKMSTHEGPPIVNCDVVKPAIDLSDNIYIEREDRFCLIEKVPSEPYFKVKHPIIYMFAIRYGNLIALIGLIICVWPKRKDESKQEEGDPKAKDRETEE